MNTLSIVASFGALVWIFQDGNLSALLGDAAARVRRDDAAGDPVLRPVRAVDGLRGVPADAHARAWEATGDNPTAVAHGLERSGRIVTSAALIVIVVAGSFAFADIVLIKALGVGIAIAVALDATVVRALLVPATMRLLGRWNWWLPLVRGAAPAGDRRRGARRVTRLGGRRLAVLAIVVAQIAAACSAPILANEPIATSPSPPTPTGVPSAARGPDPHRLSPRRRSARSTDRVVVLHRPPARDRRAAASGSRPSSSGPSAGRCRPAWAAHLALTDEQGNRFVYAQRSEIGTQVDRSPRDASGTRTASTSRSAA